MQSIGRVAGKIQNSNMVIKRTPIQQQYIFYILENTVFFLFNLLNNLKIQRKYMKTKNMYG